MFLLNMGLGYCVFSVKMWWFCLLLVSIPVKCQYNSINYNGYYGNSSSVCTDQNHLLLTPGVLAAGSSNRLCLSRFHPDGSAQMTITLLLENQQTVNAFRDLAPGDGGCIDVSVPQLPNTKAELIVNIRYPACSWERRLALRVASGRVVVVHSERARYRPGDTLRARVIALKADLTPAHGVIDEIWLEGPHGAWEGARAVQWVRTRTKLGIAQVQHDLDELAPTGKWTIKARLGDGSEGTAAFWVGNYELPPFQLSVRHAPKVLRTSERLVWTVCVRYPWSEAVEGMLMIRLRGAGGGNSNGDSMPGIRTVVRLRAPRACHRHAAAARRIGLDRENSPDVVVADFSFQEEGTRVWQNTTVVSQVLDKPISLEFLVKQHAVIAPGLPYKIKVKAIRWDDKPAANERIHICRSPSNQPFAVNDTAKVLNSSRSSSEVCSDTMTDAEGIARVMFTTDSIQSLFYRFQASLSNDTNVATTLLYLPLQNSGPAHASLGPLRTDSRSSKSFVPLYLNLTEVTTALTVHFVVITRIGIIYRWGATTQCPITNIANQIQTASRNGPCNAHVARLDANAYQLDASALNFDANASDALMDRHLLRVILPIKVTQQMCPNSQLIAYFYYKGHMISASKYFEMDECTVNKVEVSWTSRQNSPGSLSTLQLQTLGPALCTLTVLDTNSKLAPSGQSIKEALMIRLRRLMDSYRNLTQYDSDIECFDADTPELVSATSMELTLSWLASVGIRTLGGQRLQRKKCSRNTAPGSLMTDDYTVPRSDFSEAWLWRLVGIGANGSALVSAKAPDSITRFEANAFCVAKNGVGISPPAVLQVFRDFFIHADSPKRLKRGDSTILRYRIFNYLYEPLSVQIQIFTTDHLEVPSDYVDVACISARASAARRVEMLARKPGTARLNIRAKAVRDGNCDNYTTIRYSNFASDEVVVQITIDPEGVPVNEQKSTLLCGSDGAEFSTSKVTWNWPEISAVPGTETLTLWAIGDFSGPLLADSDALVMLPRGCGEQNMARLATNLLALRQLDPYSTAAITAKEHVAKGFTRQLQYIHPLGGFSAFGASDPTPSTWLTAFAIRYLRKAHQILTPGQPVSPALDRAERWLLNQQMENGCFRNEGQVFHRELKGGLNEDGEIASIALTAYVITSLIESSTTLPVRVLRNTISCLRALPLLKTKPPRVYAHALLAYTFMRLKTYEEDLKKTNDASLLWDGKGIIGAGLKDGEEMRELVELLKMARRSGDLVWWETGSLSTSIEATSYALLTLSSCSSSLRESSCAQDAWAAIRWLSLHRNAAGGFISTQDTLVALEALTSWSSVQPRMLTNLTVTAISSGSIKSMVLQPGVKIPILMKMALGDQLKVTVQGTGCALVQATRSYNTLVPNSNPGKELSVQVSVHTDGPFDCNVNKTRCFCAARVETCVIWTGEFPEMALLEVALPGGFGADASLLYSQLQQPNTLLRRIEMSQNGGRVTLYLATRDGSDTMGRGGHQCFSLHAVGPRTKTKPAHARLLDYYRPAVNDTQMYTIPEDCPPRISEEAKDYSPTYNLFNKARSLDSGEIIITDDYPLDDFPEGTIPLEDPTYDNLTKRGEVRSNYLELKEILSNNNSREGSKTNKEFNGENDTNCTKVNNNRNITLIRDTSETSSVKNQDNVIGSTDMLNSVVKEYKQALNDSTVIGTKKASNEGYGNDNPSLSNFHVINRETDLDVPTGIEGPVPTYVLPPHNFVTVPPPIRNRPYLMSPAMMSPSRVSDPRSHSGLPLRDPYYYRPVPPYYSFGVRRFISADGHSYYVRV